MKKRVITNMAASVRERLAALQKKQSLRDYQGLMVQYALERLLYRLSISTYYDRFLVKGAMLFTIWNGSPHRMTRDLDLLGSGNPSIQELEDIFKELAEVTVDDDGVIFESSSVRGAEIRAESRYRGVRIEMIGKIGSARLPLQIDIGFGDDYGSKADEVSLPSLIGMPSPQLRAYHRETVLAEKLEAVVHLGLLNTRLKDYFDFWFLGRNFAFEGQAIATSIRATFARRETAIPDKIPRGLTEDYWSDRARVAAWNSFWKKAEVTTEKPELETVVKFVAEFLGPPLAAVSRKEPFNNLWLPSGPWRQMATQPD